MNYSTLPSDELVRACCEPANELAWVEFIRRFQPLVAKIVIRIARRWNVDSREVLDDLVQETYAKLCANDCKLLREFQSRSQDSFFAFLKVLTANVVHDHFKAKLAAKRGGGELVTLDVEAEEIKSQAPATYHHGLIETERLILLRQIDQKLSHVVAPQELKRSRLVFWLYFRTGMTASSIAAMPSVGLTTKGVESLIFRLTQQVKSVLSDPSRTPEKTVSDQPPKGIKEAESF